MKEIDKKEIHVCIICGGTHIDEDIFRIYKLDDKKVCELCLQTTVAPASPPMFINFHNKGEIVYEDLDKEDAYIQFLEDEDMDAYEFIDYSADRVNEKPSKVATEAKTEKFNIKTPKDMKDYLDINAVGQDDAKKVLSVAVYNHFKRLKLQTSSGVKMKKNNILLAGSTGVGKTFITQLIAQKLDIPFAVADANTITQAGYVGGDVEDILERLYEKANNDLNKAQKGIVFIDEIDKICAKEGRNGTKSRDPSGEGAQQALLKLIEGGEFRVEIGRGGNKNSITFDTTDVLFIVAGAFSDIEGIVKAREVGNDRNFLGGEVEEMSRKEIYQKINFDDFEEFGIIPELLGRLPVRVSLRPLTEEDLIAIMSKIDNSLVTQYKKLLKEDGVELKVTRGALQQIARNAILNNSGARGLQGLFEELLRDVMFEAPSDDSITEFNITKKSVVDLMK